VALDAKYSVNDFDFKRLIAILRLSVPYTGLILTARENPELRREVMSFGVSQIDAGSRIELGAYTEAGDAQSMEREQFELGDIRPLDVVMRELLEDGFVPSFCTSCYRLGRTGERFMEYAIPGFIKNFCTPNALLTLMEYLVDYASPETKAEGEKAIKCEYEKLNNDLIQKKLLERLNSIKAENKRDLYF
jgi:2-iminoacetate synthase